MLNNNPVYATLPTPDLQRSRAFYEQMLGFEVLEATPAGTYYRAGDGTYFAVTRSSGAASGTHTQMGFRVANIVAEVAELRDRGIVFEEYETPKTVDGIATLPIGRSAWFKDPDGNTIGMIQFESAT